MNRPCRRHRASISRASSIRLLSGTPRSCQTLIGPLQARPGHPFFAAHPQRRVQHGHAEHDDAQEPEKPYRPVIALGDHLIHAGRPVFAVIATVVYGIVKLPPIASIAVPTPASTSASLSGGSRLR